MDMHIILSRINELQKPLGLSDRALSLKASGSTDLIRNWRRSASSGKPTSANAQSLSEVAAALNVSLEELIADAMSPQAREIGQIADMLPEELRLQLRGYAAALADQWKSAQKASASGSE